MRTRYASALALSAGLHLLPLWWYWPNPGGSGDEPVTVALLAGAGDVGGVPREGRSGTTATSPRALAVRDALATLRADLQRARDDEAAARQELVAAERELQTVEADQTSAAEVLAEAEDRARSSAGLVRMAAVEEDDAERQAREAVVGERQADEQARAALDRVSLAAAAAANASAAASGEKRRPHGGAPDLKAAADVAQVRVNAERARADAAAMQAALAAAAVEASAERVRAQATRLAPLQAAAEADQAAVVTARAATVTASATAVEATDRVAKARAQASERAASTRAAETRARTQPAALVQVPAPSDPEPRPMTAGSTAPPSAHSTRDASASAADRVEGTLRAGHEVAPSTWPATSPAGSPSTAASPLSAQAPGAPASADPASPTSVGGQPQAPASAGDPAGDRADRPANSPVATTPSAATATTSPHGTADATGEGGGDDEAAGGPLRFVRTGGTTAATTSRGARYIGTSAETAAIEMRAPTSTAPDHVYQVATATPTLQAPSPTDPPPAPSPHAAPPAPAALPPLAWTGRAPDGFALVLDEEALAPSKRAKPTPDDTPAPAQTVAKTSAVALSPDAFWTPQPLALTPENPTNDAHDPAGDLAVLPEDVAVGAITALTVSAHPLAAWMDGLDQQLRDRWTYPPEQRALGVEGTVELRFDVLPNGRTANVAVTRSDAAPELVFAALASVPTAVEPPPPGWGRLAISYTYRYRGGRAQTP